MKRINVGKKELIAELIETIIEEPGEEIVLVVPKGASIGESVSNFHLLNREAKAAGKKIIMESVDESVLALAMASQIEAHHPLLDSRPASALSDIVPRSRLNRERAVVNEHRVREAEPVRGEKIADEPLAAVHEENLVTSPMLEAKPHRLRLRFNPRILLWLIVAFGVIWGGIYLVGRFWSRAAIEITFKKTPWTYNRVFTADASVSKPDLEKNILPGELFTLEKNTVQPFPASGRSNVSIKAEGKIVIYNAYSSKPQILVATTRFEIPDGKIFRILDQAVVPAAEIKDGKIIPSKIEANILADKAGPEYNVGPIPKLTIPGFKGTPRYAGFYGEIMEPTKGGFKGEKAVPTPDDITRAKTKTAEVLKTSLQSNFLSAYPADFEIPGGASEVRVTKLKVNTNTDETGKFNVFGEANMRAIGFKESDLKSFLLALVSRDDPKLVFKELNLTYKDVSPDFVKKKMTFNLSASGTLWADFSEKDFTASILGKKVSEARSTVSSLKDLSTAKISIWPVWVGRIPNDASKIKISVY